ncbi:DeoR/GlpR family DNA-binding transcription regulator [Phyllobacterium endophyticum]|uniref:DeoR/GlpR transcriptional regulator n=1 Tax=Phyllobacterium endophyticum TaxID=1149773 RepID=A0A2P7AS11_9HYPH|nr:DeoR/GlpR family DNA-binding transcription regulator [Phyllobacterium endophyticum]MBB3236731.1 DeoR/GlpR family transcriptional regulator of sugar metabolism [Phyllobacterium endophyticum]PSH57016.1 DeoR/GlpR transcriptional regulator [Phyllobacterium endophyticum]TYR39702.1 DeoR/GlpR transcriptional regulator [Phyllobacterium endophyticum]
MKKDLSPDERKEIILKQIGDSGRVLANVAAAQFGVSEDSIRRDLRELADLGLVKRFHGGATRMSSGRRNFQQRADEKMPERKLLATAAASRIPDKSTMLLDSSTTVLEFVRAMPNGLEVSIMTGTPEIASAALDRDNGEVILIGGTLNPSTRSTVGASALAVIQSSRFDVCVLGACAIDADLVLRAESYDDAYLKTAMGAACTEIIVLATSDKLFKQANFAIGPVSMITTLFTDDGADESIVQRIRDEGVEVVVVERA